MEVKVHLSKARAHAAASAARRREAHRYQLAWRSSYASELMTLAEILTWLGWKETTLRSRLSSARNALQLTRTHPLSGEPDVVVVSRVSLVKAAPRRHVGRPRQKPLICPNCSAFVYE